MLIEIFTFQDVILICNKSNLQVATYPTIIAHSTTIYNQQITIFFTSK